MDADRTWNRRPPTFQKASGALSPSSLSPNDTESLDTTHPAFGHPVPQPVVVRYDRVSGKWSFLGFTDRRKCTGIQEVTAARSIKTP
jgi:hypothetical protein